MTVDNLTVLTIDATGLHCPMPLLKLKQALHQLPTGAQVLLKASDPNSQTDIQRFCQINGHQVQLQVREPQYFEFMIQKAHS